MKMPIAGVYECRILAMGLTPSGDTYSREQIRTAAALSSSAMRRAWIPRRMPVPPA
jgi:hypothetical protein